MVSAPLKLEISERIPKLRCEMSTLPRITYAEKSNHLAY
jgi:hypothetical protein